MKKLLNISTLKLILRKIYKIIITNCKSMVYYFFRVFPIKNNKIVVTSYYGNGFGDNPKYIILELLKQKEKYDIVWLIRKDIQEKFPEGIRTVKYNSIKSIYEEATARVWIDNCRKRKYVRKRKNQYYIQTWHGGLGIKKIEGDVEEVLSEEYIKMCKNDSGMTDLLISNSGHLTNIYKRAFWYCGEIYEVGYPKNDILFNKNDDIKYKVRSYFNISENKKIIVYAPTFRADYKLTYYDIDFNLLRETLNNKTNDEWVVMVRLHPTLATSSNILIKDDKNIINATFYPDMEEIAIASDMFISDYSSCIFDAGILRIPTFIYASDKQEYMKDRGFYFQLEELPFEVAINNEQLMNNILKFDKEVYETKLNNFNKKVGLKDNGKASKRIAKKIENIVNEVKR